MVAQQAVLQQRLSRSKFMATLCQALVLLALVLTCLQVLLRVKSHAHTESMQGLV